MFFAMKLKLSSIVILSLFVSSSAFAKVGSITNENINKKTSQNSNSEEIKTPDLDKLFADAEKYHKAAKTWKKIKCEPKSGFLCSKHECVKRDIKASLILDKEKKVITRCEGQNCESFGAEFEQTGVYYNIQSKGPIGTLIRVLGDSRYKEISTVALDAYVANGECAVVAE
jgi:hypothetical protein